MHVKLFSMVDTVRTASPIPFVELLTKMDRILPNSSNNSRTIYSLVAIGNPDTHKLVLGMLTTFWVAANSGLDLKLCTSSLMFGLEPGPGKGLAWSVSMARFCCSSLTNLAKAYYFDYLSTVFNIWQLITVPIFYNSLNSSSSVVF